MAWSTEAFSADEIAWAAADKPMISTNALYGNVTVTMVGGTTVGDATNPDDSESGYDSVAMHDGMTGLQARCDTSSVSTTIVVDASSAPIEFDWIGFLNHNLDSGGVTAFTIQVADDDAFTVRLQSVQTNNISTALTSDRRYANLDVNIGASALRMTNVAYARIQITASAPLQVYLGELIFGRRYQQPYHPDMPWDPLNNDGNAGDHVSRSGSITRLSRARGQRLMGARFQHDTAALQAEVLEWWADIEGGQAPFFYHDAPDANPMDFYVMSLDDTRLDYPHTSAVNREWAIDAAEMGPNFFSQDP